MRAPHWQWWRFCGDWRRMGIEPSCSVSTSLASQSSNSSIASICSLAMDRLSTMGKSPRQSTTSPQQGCHLSQLWKFNIHLSFYIELLCEKKSLADEENKVGGGGGGWGIKGGGEVYWNEDWYYLVSVMFVVRFLNRERSSDGYIHNGKEQNLVDS